MKRAALIVGIDKYSALPPLKYAVADAVKLNGLFEYELQFDTVRHLINPNKDHLLDTLDQVKAGLCEGDLLLFFFAGHGVEFQNRHLLLCPGASRQELEDLHQAIPINQLVKRTEKTGLQRLFIIDACRNDVRQGFRDATGGAMQGSGLQGIGNLRDIGAATDGRRPCGPPPAMLCSCDENERALELESHGQGLFSLSLQQTLLEEKRRGGQVLLNDDLLAKVKDQMAKLLDESGLEHRQNPWLKSTGEKLHLFQDEGNAMPRGEQQQVGAKRSPPPPVPSQPTGKPGKNLWWIAAVVLAGIGAAIVIPATRQLPKELPKRPVK